MAKWFGKVGYIINEETEPGVWEHVVTEQQYFGDLLSNMTKWVTSNKVNDDLNVANRISIVADPFAYQNFSSIKYIEYMGELWEVSSVEVKHPRIILTVGGVYNGK